MNQARSNPEIDSRRPLRARRREAGLVAEYIHELSDRHGREHGHPAEQSRDRPADDESQGA